MASGESPIQGGPTSDISLDQDEQRTWPAFRKLTADCCGDRTYEQICNAAGLHPNKLHNFLSRPDRKEMMSKAEMKALAPVYDVHWSRIYETQAEDYGWPVGAGIDDPFIRAVFKVIRHMGDRLHWLPAIAEELALLTGEHLRDLVKFLKQYRKLDAAQRTVIFETAKRVARIEGLR